MIDMAQRRTPWLTDAPTGSTCERSASGWLVRNERFPHLYWQNFLLVDRPEARVDALVTELERAMGDDVPHRHVVFQAARAAERARPDFVVRGWEEGVLLTMDWRRPRDREPPSADIHHVSASRLAPVVETAARRGPRGHHDEVVRELVDLKYALEAGGVRFLAALVHENVAGWCELRTYSRTGQVEDLNVLDPFQGRGLARALICHGADYLRERGCDRVFVVADDADSVKHLYDRLGFDTVCRTWSFRRPAIGS